jgi:hypothetical protein
VENMKNKRLYRIAGISGVLLGVYLMYKNNPWGAIPFGIGLSMLLWRFNTKWW